jgi:hypothetical protein
MIENEHTERYTSLLRKPSQNSDPRNVNVSVQFVVEFSSLLIISLLADNLFAIPTMCFDP